MAATNNAPSGVGLSYSMVEETKKALEHVLKLSQSELPAEVLDLVSTVKFSAKDGSDPYFPAPMKETETMGALKAIEAAAAAAVADLRFGKQARTIDLDLEKASCFLFSTYVATVGGFGKQDPESKKLLKDTDLLGAQSNLYRRLSANLYETKDPGQYYHIHGSLEATKTLNMIGLEGHRPDITDYHQAIELIGSHVKQYTVAELEVMNNERAQAGVPAIKWEDFQQTPHGKAITQEPPWSLEAMETSSPPVRFPEVKLSGSTPQVLAGIKVIEFCRIIAGPAIGRGLAEYGAEVIKITNPKLSDVPFFQVDGNLGKHTVDMDLRDPEQRKEFEVLLQSADVILDGYRPGSLARLGYGPTQLVDLFKPRDRGFVYVSEDCFGFTGEWYARPGWQQIADCVSGVAWAQGQFMGLNEPVVPPFPMSDYGTGCQGTIAALTGLYKRAKSGGSYWGKTSIVQYDILLMKQGLYSKKMQKHLRELHDPDFFGLRHYDSVDEVGKRALRSMRRNHPQLFEDRLFNRAWSKGYNAEIKYLKPVVHIEGTRNGFSRCSRPNGFDKPTWQAWEIEPAMVDAS